VVGQHGGLGQFRGRWLRWRCLRLAADEAACLVPDVRNL